MNRKQSQYKTHRDSTNSSQKKTQANWWLLCFLFDHSEIMYHHSDKIYIRFTKSLKILVAPVQVQWDLVLSTVKARTLGALGSCLVHKLEELAIVWSYIYVGP